MKVIVFANRGLATAALARTRAAGNAAARRATFIGSAIAARVPATWNGQGNPPTGYTVPYGVVEEPNGRFAIVAEDAFAVGRPDFAAADDKLPDDWDRGNGQGQAGASPPRGR
jgi:hypothetical protein